MRSAAVLLALAVLAAPPAANAAGAAGSGHASFEHVHALAVDADGRALWLGAHTGLYHSEDEGKTWTKVGLAGHGHGPDVMTITPHPTNAAVLYIGTHEAGVLVTSDGGKTWTAANAGLRGLDVHGLAIDLNAPTKLHALVRETGAGLYRTIDSGRSWVRVDDGPPGETKVLASVNIPTGMGGIFLYAGTGEGLQRSPDCF